MQLWLNYRDSSSYNRVTIKKCNKGGDNSYTCQGCKQTLKTNPSNDLTLNQITWNLAANFESTSLNYLVETYLIDVITSINATNAAQVPKLRPFWKNVKFPSVKVRIILFVKKNII